MMLKIYALLSSRRFLMWFIGAWIFYYVTFAVWSREAFAGFVVNLEEGYLFKLLYIVFMSSAVLNLVRAGRERAARSRTIAFLWMLLPVGALLFLLGFFISVNFKQSEWILAGEGDVIRPAWQSEGIRVLEFKPALKDKLLDVENLEFSIFAYEPKVLLEAPEGTREVGVFPPRRIDGAYYHILKFNMAPGLRLEKDDEILAEGYMAVNILPPGIQDVFEIRPYPYRFRIKIKYEKIIEKHGARAKLYNIKSPLYDVVVEKGDKVIFMGGSDEKISFNGLTLSFYEPDYWVMIEAASDPGLPIVALGIALIVAGLPISLLLAVRSIVEARRHRSS
jgi:hypothetical protein